MTQTQMGGLKLHVEWKNGRGNCRSGQKWSISQRWTMQECTMMENSARMNT